jgi:hypothetical protein
MAQRTCGILFIPLICREAVDQALAESTVGGSINAVRTTSATVVGVMSRFLQ